VDHRLSQATCDLDKYEVREKAVGIGVPPVVAVHPVQDQLHLAFLSLFVSQETAPIGPLQN